MSNFNLGVTEKLAKMELDFIENTDKYLNDKKQLAKLLEKYADALVDFNIAKPYGIISIETFYDVIVQQLGLNELGYDKEFVATIFRQVKSKYDRQKTGAIEYKPNRGKCVLVDRVGLYLRQKRILNKYFGDIVKEFGVTNFMKAFESVLMSNSYQ